MRALPRSHSSGKSSKFQVPKRSGATLWKGVSLTWLGAMQECTRCVISVFMQSNHAPQKLATS